MAMHSMFAMCRTFFHRCIFQCLILFVSCIITACVDHDILVHEDLRTDLLQAINKLRENGCKCGNDMMPPVPALIWNNVLETAANNHVTDMYTNNYFSHLSRDGSPPITRAQQAGYEGEYVGENIARGYYRIADVMKAWQQSESHCKAMMDTLYREAGASQFKDYWVLDFGRPPE
jgi:uncharacterized protein YkwD